VVSLQTANLPTGPKYAEASIILFYLKINCVYPDAAAGRRDGRGFASADSVHAMGVSDSSALHHNSHAMDHNSHNNLFANSVAQWWSHSRTGLLFISGVERGVYLYRLYLCQQKTS
jgi:hypothetical protein